MIEPEEPRHFKLKQLDASTLCRIAGRDVSKTTKNLSETCTWFWNNVDHVPIEYPTGKEPRHDESGFSLVARSHREHPSAARILVSPLGRLSPRGHGCPQVRWGNENAKTG